MYPNNFLTLWKQRELNEQRVITLSEISRVTGVHMVTLRLFRDKVMKQPHRQTLNKLATYFNVQPDQIMKGSMAIHVWLREQSYD